MRIYVPILLLAVASCLLSSCTSNAPKPDPKVQDIPKPTGTSIDGKYLVDNVFFPQDTLVLHKMQASDSTTRKKLLVELKNDSIYLSNYNFGGWYGKWFCPFHEGKMRFEKDHLYIHASINNLISENRCPNKTVWQKIAYQLISQSDSTLTFLKISDTSNCPRFLLKRDRGADHFSKMPRGDIQLR